MENIEIRHKKIVENILRQLITEANTQSIFILWPNLKVITERFCNFVSPLMPSSNGDPLVAFAIQSAIKSYRSEKEENRKGRAYVLGLIDASTSLSDITVQGIRNDIVITWEPYIEPMFNWMVKNDVMTIRTSKNKTPAKPLSAKRAVLVHILSDQDMVSMGLESDSLHSL